MKQHFRYDKIDSYDHFLICQFDTEGLVMFRQLKKGGRLCKEDRHGKKRPTLSAGGLHCLYCMMLCTTIHPPQPPLQKVVQAYSYITLLLPLLLREDCNYLHGHKRSLFSKM